MRQFVLLLSMGTIVLYGYALAGMGGYLLGRGRIDYILWGFLGGSFCAWAALFLWKKYLLALEWEQKESDDCPRR